MMIKMSKQSGTLKEIACKDIDKIIRIGYEWLTSFYRTWKNMEFHKIVQNYGQYYAQVCPACVSFQDRSGYTIKKVLRSQVEECNFKYNLRDI